jgi:uncharacterized membrane protein
MHAPTPFGAIHVLISLAALLSGLIAFVRDKGIDPATIVGKVYIWTTALTGLTGFTVFAHGGLSKAHALSAVTLLALGAAWLGDQGRFGARSVYVSTLCYSLTFMFHMFPTVTGVATRLPPDGPPLASPGAPALKVADAVVVLLYLIGATLQVRRLRARGR